MANERLKFYQIYYRDDQLSELYDFATPYKNNQLTPFFENFVIADLVPKTEAEFISVCSWRLRHKRGGLFRLTDKSLSEEKILSHDFDIAILTPRSPSHNVMVMAAHWHGKAWTDAIDELRKIIRFKEPIKYAIYENHFIARKYIYQSYVSDCLIPVIDYMSTRDIFFVDSGYVRKKINAGQMDEVRQYRALSGRQDWPIAPFILERLFSIWINDKNYKVITL